jgi:hypothetical protein
MTTDFAIEFEKMPWETPSPGIRLKTWHSDGKQVRLVEFTQEFVEPLWCEKGHVGMVLLGELEIDFKGQLVRYPEGTGILIPAGPASAHRGRSVTPVTRLFLVEEVV